MEEIEYWRVIAGWPYRVSNLGRVQSFRGTVLAGSTDKKGYRRVCLQHQTKKINRPVHRLVAEAFLPNPENKSQVHHKDHNPRNNRLDNLEWCTPQENISYSVEARRYRKTYIMGIPRDIFAARMARSLCIEESAVQRALSRINTTIY
jgi:hypothetical protein